MSIIDNVKDVVKLVQKLDNVELLQETLKLQTEIVQLTNRVKQKDEEIAQLKQTLDVKRRLVRKGSAYYVTDQDGKITDGPFCTRCFDIDHVSCRIVSCGIEPEVSCPNCKAQFSCKETYHYLRPDLEEDRKKFKEMFKNQRVQRAF